MIIISKLQASYHERIATDKRVSRYFLSLRATERSVAISSETRDLMGFFAWLRTTLCVGLLRRPTTGLLLAMTLQHGIDVRAN